MLYTVLRRLVGGSDFLNVPIVVGNVVVSMSLLLVLAFEDLAFDGPLLSHEFDEHDFSCGVMVSSVSALNSASSPNK